MPEAGTGKRGWFGKRDGSGTALDGQAGGVASTMPALEADLTAWPPVRTQVSVLVADGNARVLETTVIAHDLSRGELLLLAPATDDATFATIRGKVVFVEWTSTAGLHQLEGLMLDVAPGVLPMWRIEVADEPEVINRRRFLRVRKVGPVPLSVGSVEVQGSVINISEGGLRFEIPSDDLITGLVESEHQTTTTEPGSASAGTTDRPVVPGVTLGQGSRLELSIDLGAEGSVAAGGKVTWVRRSRRRIEVGVSFETLPEAKVSMLRRHVFSLQQAARAQKRT